VYRGHAATVHLMLPFGPQLLTVDTEGVLKVWDIKTGAEYLEMTFNNEKTLVSALCHPSTYIDKVLVGSSQGHLQLWNLKSTKLIYTFSGWSSGVTALEQAPAIDVVAIGLRSGEVFLHNLKFDETVVKFQQDWGPVTGVAFRTDDKPVMVTGSPAGRVAVWDLEGRKLALQMRSCHQGAVTGLQCLAGEPIMVTSSPDNSLRQ
jgi:U3 small nucleolar RNA-associated protein 21